MKISQNISPKNKVSFATSVVRGFTLIELLVVISIIGLLSSVVFASLNKARAKSRDSKKIQDLIQLRNALELYYSTYKQYPQTFGSDVSTAIRTNCQMTSSIPPFTSLQFPGSGWTDAVEWVPGLVSSDIIPALAPLNSEYVVGSGGFGCYFYMSNGTDYKLSHTNTLETLCADNTGPFCEYGILGSSYFYSATINTPGAAGWRIQRSDESAI